MPQTTPTRPDELDAAILAQAERLLVQADLILHDLEKNPAIEPAKDGVVQATLSALNGCLLKSDAITARLRAFAQACREQRTPR
jgi:hypothetical protein